MGPAVVGKETSAMDQRDDSTAIRDLLAVRSIDRRTLLRAGLVGAGAAALPFVAPPSTARGHGSRLFGLGVASGDPGPRSVVLWTRLAPAPLEGGGLSPDPFNARVDVRWEVATDPRMRRVVQCGETRALAAAAHTVHVTVRGLEPDRWYYYRFHARGEDSPVGRTRTFPARHDLARRMRFALVSCQDWQNGFYSAYQNLADENLDFVLHVGDYIYEGGVNPLAPRQHNGGEIITLADYRSRYALYRTDPALQAAHAAFPFIATFDDHEVDNNYAGDIPEDAQAPAAFLQRRAAGYQAYYEHLPLGADTRPTGASIPLFRRFRFGRLADLHVLDTRQFRSDQPCGDGLRPPCAAVFDPNATMTGAAQERWLFDGLDRSQAVWNVIGQQVMLMKWNIGPGIPPTPGVPPGTPFFNVDAWDGYVVARQRLLDFLAARGPANPVVLTGDIHSAWAADILETFEQPGAGIVAAEFVTTSITSDFPAAFLPAVAATLPANPHIKYFEGLHRGYLRFDVDRRQWRADFRGVDSIATPTSPVSTLKSFVLEAGHSGLQPA
jgi:alkaline phosphatase D